MISIIQGAIAAFVLIACGALVAGMWIHWKKNRIVAGVEIHAHTGDSETMVLKCNFLEGESEDSKDSKIIEAYERIDNRRLEQHEKMLKIREEARKENEEKVARGEKLALRSVSEEPAT